MQERKIKKIAISAEKDAFTKNSVAERCRLFMQRRPSFTMRGILAKSEFSSTTLDTLRAASLPEAIEALKKDHDYLLEGGVFTEELLNNWIKAIEKEHDEIEKVPHPAEFRLYYDL